MHFLNFSLFISSSLCFALNFLFPQSNSAHFNFLTLQFLSSLFALKRTLFEHLTLFERLTFHNLILLSFKFQLFVLCRYFARPNYWPAYPTRTLYAITRLGWNMTIPSPMPLVSSRTPQVPHVPIRAHPICPYPICLHSLVPICPHRVGLTIPSCPSPHLSSHTILYPMIPLCMCVCVCMYARLNRIRIFYYNSIPSALQFIQLIWYHRFGLY